jgi:hypothetical protein
MCVPNIQKYLCIKKNKKNRKSDTNLTGERTTRTAAVEIEGKDAENIGKLVICAAWSDCRIKFANKLIK